MPTHDAVLLCSGNLPTACGEDGELRMSFLCNDVHARKLWRSAGLWISRRVGGTFRVVYAVKWTGNSAHKLDNAPGTK